MNQPPISFQGNPSTIPIIPDIPPKKESDDSQNNPIDFGSKRGNQNLGYDVGNIMGMLNSMKTDATRYPWSAKQDVNTINPVFDSTNYYPIQAAQRSRMDSMNQISNPSMARSVGSYQPDQINGILQETQRVHGNNLQVANQAEAQNSQIMNSYGANEAQRQTGLYDNTVKTLDNKFIQDKLASKDFLDQFGNARNNKAQMAYLLAQNPQFSITNPNDYSSLIQFDGNGKSLANQGTNQTDQADQVLSHYNKFKDRGFDHDQIIDLLRTIHGGKEDSRTTTKKPGQQGSTVKQTTYVRP
jgi:hypothetical protein